MSYHHTVVASPSPNSSFFASSPCRFNSLYLRCDFQSRISRTIQDSSSSVKFAEDRIWDTMNLSYSPPIRAPINNPCGIHSISSRCSTIATARKMCHEECYGILHSGANSWNWKNRTENLRLIQTCCFLKKNGSHNVRLYRCTNAPGFDYRAALALSKESSVGVSRSCIRSPAHENEPLRGCCSRLWLRQSRTLKLRCDTTASTLASDVNPSPAKRSCHSETVCDAGTSDMEVRSDSDSSDSAKEEVEWEKSSVSTASGALAEWRSARTRSGQAIVDWGRYHLQVMFVDRSHRVRSRLAEGLFERIAAWSGYGLILYGHSCGLSAKAGERPSMGYQGEAHRLGIARHVFKAPATTLDRSDLDSYDLIVAMDIEVRDEVLLVAGCKSSGDTSEYSNKVRLMSEFVSYGNIEMLEDSLREIVQPSLPEALTAHEVQQTYLSQYSTWRTMVATITMCCAGLVRFLIDEYPADLPDYDPVD